MLRMLVLLLGFGLAITAHAHERGAIFFVNNSTQQVEGIVEAAHADEVLEAMISRPVPASEKAVIHSGDFKQAGYEDATMFTISVKGPGMASTECEYDAGVDRCDHGHALYHSDVALEAEISPNGHCTVHVTN